MPDTISAAVESSNNGESPLTVYIFGAGASVTAGYPTAAEFSCDIEQYFIRLSSAPPERNVDRLKRTISSTIKHLEETGAETIDELVGTLNDTEAVEDAKTATEAVFLDLENRLTCQKLRDYSNFLVRACLSPGNAKVEDRLRSDVRVLTFNYDRALEIAYSLLAGQDIEKIASSDSRINQIRKESLKSSYNSLNTGFQDGHGIKVIPGSFAYLKLHGSVGLKAQDADYGFLHKQPFCDVGKIIDDDSLWNNEGKLKVRSLIVFPHEKPSVVHGQSELAFNGYVAKVESAASNIIRKARRIHICGYSVCNPEWSRFEEIIKHAPTDCIFVVHNTTTMPADRLEPLVYPRKVICIQERFSESW